MKTASFPAIGTLDRTLPSPGDATYQTESLALTLHDIIKDMSDNGFEFQLAEASDFTSFGGDAQDAIDDYITRYEEILQNGFSSVVATLPDVLPIISTVLSGGGDAVLSILLQGVLDTILRHQDRRSDSADGEELVLAAADVANLTTAIEAITAELELVKAEITTQTTDVMDDMETGLADMTAKLEEMRITITGILNTFNINLYEDDMGASWSVGPVVE